MTDTRAGLLAAAHDRRADGRARRARLHLRRGRDRTFESLLEAAVQPAGILLPIVGILLVSSEWSQRTAPHARSRSSRAAARARRRSCSPASAVASSRSPSRASRSRPSATAIAAPARRTPGRIPAGLLVPDRCLVVTAMLGGIAFGAPAARLRAGDRPLLRGCRSAGPHRLDPGPRDAGAVARRHALLAPLVTEDVMSGTEWARAAPRSRCGCCCRWRSACGGSPAARCR